MKVYTEGPRAGGFMVWGGEGNIERQEITLLHGEKLGPGHVLGAITTGAQATAEPASGNTGSAGAMSAITVAAPAREGVYELVITEPGAAADADATPPVAEVRARFELRDPGGVTVGAGAIGTAFAGGGLGFTLTIAAEDYAAGDRYLITVSGGTLKYKEYDPAHTDGSQEPAGILWDYADATDADVRAVGVVRACQVNAAELVWFAGATATQIAIAIRALERNTGIVARPAVP